MKRFFNLYRRLLLCVATICILIPACSRHQQIVLTSRDGSHQLVYDADAFYPQSKTQEDIGVLREASWQIIREEPQDVVTGMALKSALMPMPIPDYKELERIIYNYKVARLKKQE